MLNFQNLPILGRNITNIPNKTMDEAMEYLLAHTPRSFHNLLAYSLLETLD